MIEAFAGLVKFPAKSGNFTSINREICVHLNSLLSPLLFPAMTEDCPNFVFPLQLLVHFTGSVGPNLGILPVFYRRQGWEFAHSLIARVLKSLKLNERL